MTTGRRATLQGEQSRYQPGGLGEGLNDVKHLTSFRSVAPLCQQGARPLGYSGGLLALPCDCPWEEHGYGLATVRTTHHTAGCSAVLRP